MPTVATLLMGYVRHIGGNCEMSLGGYTNVAVDLLRMKDKL